MLARIVWILILVVATALTLEIGTRLLYVVQGEPPPHADLSVDHEWKWAHAHLETGHALLASDHTFDQKLGWTMKSNLRVPLMHTNSAGMRARQEFSKTRLPGIPRLLLVGDSYTMGATVSDYDSYHSVLKRDFFPDLEVLNFGVSGYGMDQALRMYEIHGVQYNPSVVVLGVYLRDHSRNLYRFRGYAKPYFILDDRGELALRDDHLVSPEILFEDYRSGRRRIGEVWYSWSLAAFGNAWHEFQMGRDLDPENFGWRLSAAILRRFRDRANENGSVPILLLIPTRPSRYHGTVYEQFDEFAQAEAKRLEMPTISLSEHFHAEPDHKRESPLFRNPADGGHLTVAGNRAFARLLAEGLREHLPGSYLRGSDPRPSETMPNSVR